MRSISITCRLTRLIKDLHVEILFMTNRSGYLQRKLFEFTLTTVFLPYSLPYS